MTLRTTRTIASSDDIVDGPPKRGHAGRFCEAARVTTFWREACAKRDYPATTAGPGPCSRLLDGLPRSTPHMPPRWATLTTCSCEARPSIARPYLVVARPITV